MWHRVQTFSIEAEGGNMERDILIQLPEREARVCAEWGLGVGQRGEPLRSNHIRWRQGHGLR
jgi:hypothetical protein